MYVSTYRLLDVVSRGVLEDVPLNGAGEGFPQHRLHDDLLPHLYEVAPVAGGIALVDDDKLLQILGGDGIPQDDANHYSCNRIYLCTHVQVDHTSHYSCNRIYVHMYMWITPVTIPAIQYMYTCTCGSHQSLFLQYNNYMYVHVHVDPTRAFLHTVYMYMYRSCVTLRGRVQSNRSNFN